MDDMHHEKMNYKIPRELKDVIPGYLSRRDQDIHLLKIAVHNSDFESIEKIAHKLKGNGASYGFDRLTEIGQQLMHACESKNQLAASQLTNEFQREVENIKTNIL